MCLVREYFFAREVVSFYTIRIELSGESKFLVLGFRILKRIFNIFCVTAIRNIWDKGDINSGRDLF